VVVKALCYKPVDRGFEPDAAQDPEVYSAFNRDEYQKQKNNVSGEYRMAGV
jgi:hypothetical protein